MQTKIDLFPQGMFPRGRSRGSFPREGGTVFLSLSRKRRKMLPRSATVGEAASPSVFRSRTFFPALLPPCRSDHGKTPSSPVARVLSLPPFLFTRRTGRPSFPLLLLPSSDQKIYDHCPCPLGRCLTSFLLPAGVRLLSFPQKMRGVVLPFSLS